MYHSYMKQLLPGIKQTIIISLICTSLIIGGMNIVSAAEKGGTLTKPAYQNIVSGEVILGGKNAKITIIEYSDMECPFCIRYHRETFPLIQKNFQKSVNFIWKNNRGVNHDGTEKKAIAALCVKKVAPSKYYTVIHEILSKSNEKK